MRIIGYDSFRDSNSGWFGGVEAGRCARAPIEADEPPPLRAVPEIFRRDTMEIEQEPLESVVPANCELGQDY